MYMLNELSRCIWTNAWRTHKLYDITVDECKGCKHNHSSSLNKLYGICFCISSEFMEWNALWLQHSKWSLFVHCFQTISSLNVVFFSLSIAQKCSAFFQEHKDECSYDWRHWRDVNLMPFKWFTFSYCLLSQEPLHCSKWQRTKQIRWHFFFIRFSLYNCFAIWVNRLQTQMQQCIYLVEWMMNVRCIFDDVDFPLNHQM